VKKRPRRLRLNDSPNAIVCTSYTIYDATISRLLNIIGSIAKEPYKRDCILQKRPIILRRLLIVGCTSYTIYYM